MLEVVNGQLTLGADPEFFIVNKASGEVVGSEKLIPKTGLPVKFKFQTPNPIRERAVVVDGVQAELNLRPSYCRSTFANEISSAFSGLKLKLAKAPDFKISFAGVVKITPEELASLSDECRVFGCNPSENLYDSSAAVAVDPSKYLYRSAGGHIHLGLSSPIYQPGRGVDHRRRLIPLLDALVGNTCVLIDRDPGQAERRKNYGRAGEFRLPQHGLEYRTPSNFWLQSYQLFGLVFGLARMAVSTLSTTLNNSGKPALDLERELLTRVDMGKIVRAINKNDFRLAKRNWAGVREFIWKYVQDLGMNSRAETGLCDSSLAKFDWFVKKVNEVDPATNEIYGLKRFFSEDPLEHWGNQYDLNYNHTVAGKGWETWLRDLQVD